MTGDESAATAGYTAALISSQCREALPAMTRPVSEVTCLYGGASVSTGGFLSCQKRGDGWMKG